MCSQIQKNCRIEIDLLFYDLIPLHNLSFGESDPIILENSTGNVSFSNPNELVEDCFLYAS